MLTCSALCSTVYVIENVVKNRSKALNVFPVEWSDECGANFLEDAVGNIIAYMFELFNLTDERNSFLHRWCRQSFYKNFGNGDKVGRGFFEKRIKLPVFGNEVLKNGIGRHSL